MPSSMPGVNGRGPGNTSGGAVADRFGEECGAADQRGERVRTTESSGRPGRRGNRSSRARRTFRPARARRTIHWRAIQRHARPADRRHVALVAVLFALVVGAVLVVIVRPDAGGHTVLEPERTVLPGGGLVDGGAPSAPATGPADVGVEPSGYAIEVPTSGASSPGLPPGTSPTAGRSGAAPAPGPPAAPPRPRPRYTALSGESCPQQSTAGYYRKGWASDWYSRSYGGWTGDGCRGQVVAVPMSGDPNKDDNDNVIVWWFAVGSGATCAVSVYVPGTGDVRDSDGAPATYFVYGSTDATGAAIAKFTVDQVHNQGRWVDAGAYQEGGGALSIRMVTRGIDWGSGRTGAHLGVSALRVSC
jgi:hypothetical protein